MAFHRSPEVCEHVGTVAARIGEGYGFLPAQNCSGAQIVHIKACPGRERDGEAFSLKGIKARVPKGLVGFLLRHAAHVDPIHIGIGQDVLIHGDFVSPDRSGTYQHRRQQQHDHQRDHCAPESAAPRLFLRRALGIAASQLVKVVAHVSSVFCICC